MEDWNGGMGWNGMLTIWMDLMGSHLLIMTTSEQRPPVDRPQI